MAVWTRAVMANTPSFTAKLAFGWWNCARFQMDRVGKNCWVHSEMAKLENFQCCLYSSYSSFHVRIECVIQIKKKTDKRKFHFMKQAESCSNTTNMTSNLVEQIILAAVWTTKQISQPTIYNFDFHFNCNFRNLKFQTEKLQFLVCANIHEKQSDVVDSHIRYFNLSRQLQQLQIIHLRIRTRIQV